MCRSQDAAAGCGPIYEITSESSGRFRIVTASRTVYEVDLDRRTLLRKPASIFNMPGLRLGEEKPVALLRTLACAVGAQGRFIVDLGQFGVKVTTRTTETVLEILRVEEGTDDR